MGLAGSLLICSIRLFIIDIRYSWETHNPPIPGRLHRQSSRSCEMTRDKVLCRHQFVLIRVVMEQASRRESNIAANEPVIDLKGQRVQNPLEVSDGPCLDLAQNPEEARPTVALHIFKRRSSVIGVSAIGQLDPLS
jgi:hypothetical protein